MAEESKQSKMGRPTETDYYEKYIAGKEETLKAACRNGADNSILCKLVGCGETTFKKLLKLYPDFKALLKESKEVADLAVESALYKRAVGYEYEETITEVKVDKDGVAHPTAVRKVKHHIPGDTTAQIFWLKNRKPSEWRENKEVDNSWAEALASLTDGYEKEKKKK